MEWLSHLQILVSNINLQAGKFPQYNKESKNTGLRLERMKMPQFSGDIKDYPRFKLDFQRQVESIVESEQEAASELKCCLSNVALEIIPNVDDDLKEM